MSMVENKERIEHFTSSEIHRLIGKGSRKMTDKELVEWLILNPKSKARTTKSYDTPDAPFLTYVEEKQIEGRLNRCVGVDAYTQPMAWGQFLEKYVFNMLGIEYLITSKETDKHPTIKHWSGSKDLIVPGKKISELKCYQPKKFAQYTDVIMAKNLVSLRENFSQEYWQLVSNAIINKVDYTEAISFMPYESELENIREMAYNYEDHDQWKYRFIAENDKASLPYLPDGGYYKNLNMFEFKVPQEDKDILTQRVKMAIKLLKPIKKK